MDRQSDSSPAERRHETRIPAQPRVRCKIESKELVGRARNISPHDVFFLSDEEVSVTVEIEDNGVVKRTPGHLVRLECTETGRSGWAVEFDA